MARTTLLLASALLTAACASTPSFETEDPTIFEGHTVEAVRDAARGVLEALAYGQWDVRTSDWRVLTEGRIGHCDEHVDCGHGTVVNEQTLGTPWTTVEVRFGARGAGTAVAVEIEYLTDTHCRSWPRDIGCTPERLGSTGVLEREIVERIRARLEERAGGGSAPPNETRRLASKRWGPRHQLPYN